MLLRSAVPSAAPLALRVLRPLGVGALGASAGLVLLLAAGAVTSRVLAARAEAAFPRTGELLEVDGLRQHVVVRGQGPDVVLVHGAYGALQDFQATILERASARARCVLWDRPGHGYSERPEGDVDPGVQAEVLLGVVRRLELDRPLLVGFSYGGAVCLAAALAAPDEVRGVVLLNGPSHPWPDPLFLEYRLSGVPVVGRLMAETVAAPLGHLTRERAVERAFDPLPVAPGFAASPLPLALRPASFRANTEDVRLLKPFLRGQARRYGELRVPVTAVVSTGDLVVSPTIHVPQLVEQAPDCRQIRVEGAGHQLLYTHPDLVLDTIAEALAAAD